jgi:pantoate--beta-alanine ligase
MNNEMLALFNSSNLKLEYLEIVDNYSLKPVNQVNNNCSICIAAYCGNVRLIDNCQLD